MIRERRDRCPGVLRPWPADDGALVRVRVVGGELSARQLAGLADVAREHGDGDLHLTSRANLQVRGVAHGESFVRAVEALGLLPSRRHDLARNVMVSPLSGRVGGRCDVRPVAAELDALLLADDAYADLPGRFLFTLDDGRGDLVGRETDLGLVALDDSWVQLRIGAAWGPVLPLADAAHALADLARTFLSERGTGDDAPWHVSELPAPLAAPVARDPRVPSPVGAPTDLGPALLAVADGVLTPDLVDTALAPGGAVVLTPWNSIVLTELL